MNPDVHLVGVQRTIGCELQHGFLEIEITSVAQGSRNTFTFFVQGGGRKLFPFVHFASLIRRYGAHRRFRNIHLVMANHIGLVGGDQISEVDLTVLDHFLGVHFGVKIAHVIHLLTQLLHADAGQFFVVDDRRFAHLMGIARKSFVGFGGSIRRSGVIDMQLQFPKTEDLCVLLLAQIAA